MASEKDIGNKSKGTQITMREAYGSIVLNESQKRALLVFVVGIFVAFAIALSIYNYMFPYKPPDYPGGCGNYTYELSSCLTKYAQESGNVSACGYLQGSYRDICIYSVAQSSNNASICTAMNKSSYLYPQCVLGLNVGGKNIQLCNTLTGKDELNCIYNYSVETNFSNPYSCSDINNNSYSNECKSIYYYHSALSARNASACSTLQALPNETSLYYLTKSTGYNSSMQIANLYYFATLNVSPQNYCYYTIAQLTNSISTCGLIKGIANASCESQIIERNVTSTNYDLNASTAIAACGSYSSYSKEYCYYEYYLKKAEQENNVTQCMQLNISYEQDGCILHLAINQSSIADCNYLTNSTYAGACTTVVNNELSGQKT
ncbi:MAG: hypothetical protein M1504_00995 [Candidatus Marsarchaeota archaeon]|nr:hypothetical protein [Candidatus Marsarchaeota archaeon]